MNISRRFRVLVTSCATLIIISLIYLQLDSVPSLIANFYEAAKPTYPHQNETWAAELFGRIWPTSDDGEKNNRVRSQIDFLDTYNSWKQEHGGFQRTKVIVGVGQFNLENFPEGPALFEHCPVAQCTATKNSHSWQSADAILLTEYGWGKQLRGGRKSPGQIWIAQHWESPLHNRINPNEVRDLINWTVSYRRDSTIVISYGHYEKVANRTEDVTENYAANRTKKVAMLVSNCAPVKRLAYARELARYIQVDIYGKCEKFRCPRDASRSSSICSKWLAKDYKFYLAFENSNCKDYITEKFLGNALGSNLLPIVMGASREDYAAVAPPHSYLHVDDFESPLHLAKFLYELDNNDTLYNSYFTWKGAWKMVDEMYWCRLCMLLHLQSDVGYVHWYSNYIKWWNGVCS